MSSQSIDFVIFFALALLAIGFVLSLLFTFTQNKGNGAEKRVFNLLPGMNCGQCGYPGCENYAKALVKGDVALNLCRPGGPDLVLSLAEALGVPAVIGKDHDEELFAPREVAFIHPQNCNGCSKCVRTCKADAIVGLPKQPHNVITKYCIGCADCIKSCPHECIEMIRTKPDLAHFNWDIKSVQIGQNNR